MDNLKLFDDLKRTKLDYAVSSESIFEFYNHTARPGFQYIRELLQSWFDNYDAPTDKRHRLRTEFRSEEDKQHLSAFFELYLYQLFKSQGFKVDVEPEWTQGRPDFLLTTHDGKQILLEATGTYPKKVFGPAKKRQNSVIEYLNKQLDSPDFFLHLMFTSSSSDNPTPAKIKRFVERKLTKLDYDTVVQNGSYPSFVWEYEAWTIKFTVSPKYTKRGKPGVRPIGSVTSVDYGVDDGDITSNIKSSIDRKDGHYGELSIPYILAVNVSDVFKVEHSIFDALFGVHSSGKDSAWLFGNEYQMTRMSAIVFFNWLRPETMHITNPVVWHHPGANIPLDADLVNITQKLPTQGVTPDKITYELRKGKHPSELLHIDSARMPE